MAALPQSGGFRGLWAYEMAERLDRDWFAANPGRRFHVRRSTPHERPGWDGDEHIKSPFMLVIMASDGRSLVWVPFTAKSMPADEETFLSSIWRQMQARRKVMKKPGIIRLGNQETER